MAIILSQYQDPGSSISTHDSDNIKIENSQQKILLASEEQIANSFEGTFESKYYGEPDPFYNCHGLTFAARRTGIYLNTEIWRIIKTEYIPIKSEKDVRVGDIILYVEPDDEQDISHSGMVVEAYHDGVSRIKIYSKILKGREIVHHPAKCPYYKGLVKYYRISHANKFSRFS